MDSTHDDATQVVERPMTLAFHENDGRQDLVFDERAEAVGQQQVGGREIDM